MPPLSICRKPIMSMFTKSASEPKEAGRFDNIKSSLKRIIELYIENAKLTAAEKLTLLISTAVIFLICFIFITIALAFVGIALLNLLELALSPILSAIIMAGLFIVLALLVYLLRVKLIINPTARFISKLIMDIGKNRLNS